MRTVIFDVDTQADFLLPAGALYVPGGELLIPNLGRLTTHARDHGIPIISTADAHSQNDPEFRDWPPHCVAGTAGQRKVAETLLENPAILGSERQELPGAEVHQVILEKQSLDCFTNPNLPALLELLGADRYVVYGVVTELCVSYAASGLLKTGRRVEIVSDAVLHLRREASDEFLRRFESSGGILTTTAAVCR